ncbi:MAG: hypothetical protein HY290_26945 [Planctomycetia bacterium]|nr:hypothetical protein [Planctomycetia bacterium]
MRSFCPRRLPNALMVICFATATFICGGQVFGEPPRKDIRKLSQHFLDRTGNTAPWMFVPKANIASLSTEEHPGVVTVWENGRGSDIKGILEHPIRIDDYPRPWEFHLGFVQNYQAQKGISERQINYAIGLNLAVTFSDPATWPKDRTQTPPDTHSLQLFVVHLGNVGENYRQGLPRVKGTPLNQFDPSPEAYLVYGRGDLAPAIHGNWKMAYTWHGADGSISGSHSKDGGPASSIIRFRANLLNETVLQVGVGDGLHPGWRLRTIDVSRFGKITGIWEIGPIISLDRWIPDVLAKELDVGGIPEWLKSFKQRLPLISPPDESQAKSVKLLDETFTVEPPDPKFEYFVDYAVFYGNGPENFDHLSDEFDVPGFLADQKWYIEGNGLAETFSNPGYLTVTLLGMNGGWAMCPIIASSAIDLAQHKPPLEFETAFIAPEDTHPWNYWWTFNLFDSDGKNLGQGWGPGVQNIPGTGRAFINSFGYDPKKFAKSPVFNIEFEPELPQSLLTAKPLHMLVQVLDESHVRVGFKGKPQDAWTFSKSLDTVKAFGKKIGKIGYPCIASIQGAAGQKGWGVGNSPMYQRFLIDYVRFRAANTETNAKAATNSSGPRYRIETIAGNGKPGDTPAEGTTARDVPVDLPFGVEYGPDGALYITTVGSHRVLRLDRKNGALTSVAGNGKKGYAGDGGPATEATLNEPYEVRFDSRGNMVIVEMRNHLIRRVDAKTGLISTVAGDAVSGDRGDGGPAKQARFNNPHSITLDEHDNLYVADLSNHRVRKIDAKTQQIETLAGNGTRGHPDDGALAKTQPLIMPQGLAVHGGALWIASFQGHVVWRLDFKTGVIRRVAGTGRQGHTGDGGPALEATFDGPRGVMMSPAGTLYVVEGENNVIRAFDTVRGTISTIAGAGPKLHEYAGDGVPAVGAPLSQPHGICISPDGTLVLSDTKNHRVRALSPAK